MESKLFLITLFGSLIAMAYAPPPMVLRDAFTCDNAMIIHVTDGVNKWKFDQISEKMTVLEFRKMVSKSFDIPKKTFHFTLKDDESTVLEDGQTLESYGLREEDCRHHLILEVDREKLKKWSNSLQGKLRFITALKRASS